MKLYFHYNEDLQDEGDIVRRHDKELSIYDR